MRHIVDASTVLAVILGEKGSADVVDLLSDAGVSAVNLSEVLRKLVDQGLTIADASAQCARFELHTAVFDDAQATEAARLRPLTRHLGLSFADRACLALGAREQLPIFTADRDWAKLEIGLDIRLIR
jgi:ribonuclease VapC